jgi:hypothetical protein
LSFLPSNAKHFNPLEPIVSVANSLPNLENCLSTLLAVSFVEESQMPKNTRFLDCYMSLILFELIQNYPCLVEEHNIS